MIAEDVLGREERHQLDFQIPGWLCKEGSKPICTCRWSLHRKPASPCRGKVRLKNILQRSYFVIVIKKRKKTRTPRASAGSGSNNDNSPVCSFDPCSSNSESWGQKLHISEQQKTNRAAEEGTTRSGFSESQSCMPGTEIKDRLTQSTGRISASDVSCFKDYRPSCFWCQGNNQNSGRARLLAVIAERAALDLDSVWGILFPF